MKNNAYPDVLPKFFFFDLFLYVRKCFCFVFLVSGKHCFLFFGKLVCLQYFPQLSKICYIWLFFTAYNFQAYTK